jgi:mannose-6-phosphate isomerase-like protein (cupin superfamily)
MIMDWQAESAALRKNKGLEDYEPLSPFVSKRTVERSLWYEGQLITLYVRGKQAGNTCCIWEGSIPEGLGPPPHVHHYEHEIFFVIDGSIRVWIEGEAFDVHKDSSMFLPAGRMHWFVSTSPVTRMLAVTVTASQDFPSVNNNTALFEFIGRPAESLTLPPTIDGDQMPDPAEIARVVRETNSDMPDLERLGWRRGYGDGNGNAPSAPHDTP